MKSIMTLIIISLYICGCQKSTNQITEDPKTGKPMLLGYTDRSAFELTEFSDWYSAEYNNYVPDSLYVKYIDELVDSVDIQIFMGTWCSDSRREVPRFLKILDLANFEPTRLQIVNMDRDKRSPSHTEKNKNIEFVPTIIVEKNGSELGRIVEYPIVTLESDLFSILQGIEQ